MTWTDTGLHDASAEIPVSLVRASPAGGSSPDRAPEGVTTTGGRTTGRSPRRAQPPGTTPRKRRAEEGSISIFVLGLSIIAMLLIAGTVAVTSAHLARMRLLDVADGAALSAANALDDAAYQHGLRESVPLSSASVRERAATYVGSRPKPASVVAWRLEPATGSPDGRTAVVALSADAELPMVGPALRDLGASVTISVVSRARSDIG